MNQSLQEAVKGIKTTSIVSVGAIRQPVAAEIEERITHLKTLQHSLAAVMKDVEVELEKHEGLLADEIAAEESLRVACKRNKFLHTKRTHSLAVYFKGKGLLITSLQECTSMSKARYGLAKTIFNTPQALLPVLKFLYLRKGNSFSIADHAATEKTAVCNFLTQLKKMGWLEWAKQKDEITIERKIPNDQYVFFNGGWAEDATRYLIEKTLHELNVPHKATYREVKVEDICGRGEKHEFDFIVEFKDRIFIFETKTGSLGVERWIDHARMFNDVNGPNRFLMCCNDDSLNAKLFQPYRLFHLKTLTDEFSEYVKSEFKAENGKEA